MTKNKIFLGILILLLITATMALAENLCTDSDNGPEDGRKPSSDVLTTKGSTKYGIRTLEDICVLGKNADVQTKESFFLKEYYCENDKREFEIFDCTDYGFEKCVEGVCVGTGTAGNTTKPQRQVNDCGNKILETEKGEECDPPGSLCLEGDNYGICLDDCKCRWHEEKEDEEQNEEEADESNEEDEIDESNKEQEDKEQNEELTEEQEDKYPIPDVTLPDVGETKNFSQEPGIKITSGITGFFKKIWIWFVDLF